MKEAQGEGDKELNSLFPELDNRKLNLLKNLVTQKETAALIELLENLQPIGSWTEKEVEVYLAELKGSDGKD